MSTSKFTHISNDNYVAISWCFISFYTDISLFLSSTALSHPGPLKEARAPQIPWATVKMCSRKPMSLSTSEMNTFHECLIYGPHQGRRYKLESRPVAHMSAIKHKTSIVYTASLYMLFISLNMSQCSYIYIISQVIVSLAVTTSREEPRGWKRFKTIGT